MESNQRDSQDEAIIGRDAEQPQAGDRQYLAAEPDQLSQAATRQRVYSELGNLEVEFESEIPEEGGEA